MMASLGFARLKLFSGNGKWSSDFGNHRHGQFTFLPDAILDRSFKVTSRYPRKRNGCIFVVPPQSIKGGSSKWISSDLSNKLVLFKMLSGGCLAVSLALAGSVLAGPVQTPHIVLPASARAHRDAVQQIFTESYSAYKFVHSFSSVFLLILSIVSGSSHLVMMIYHH
jgi:hypothetical protein